MQNVWNTELVKNTQDYKIEELYYLFWQDYPFAYQGEANRIIRALLLDDKEFAVKLIESLVRYITF